MELTPKTFRDVVFREKLRGGYHPEDVDEFLEQAAVATEAVLDQLRQAEERAQGAEQAAADANAAEGSLKRMLMIAQRTADQAVQEARQEAEQLLADARAKAESLLGDAEERGRRAYERGLAESRAQLEKAEEGLRQAQREAEALREWVDTQKSELVRALGDAQARLRDAGVTSEPPAITPRPPSYNERSADVPAAETPPTGPEAGETGHRLGGYSPPGPAEAAATTGHSDWDPRYLEGIEAPPAPAAPLPAGMSPSEGQPAEHGGGDQTMAFDERALDSFFSDQDLGDERGPGRFRRRP